ncbi:uncharacterized protein BO97DRAFT_426695 [Aspergillus homomorphus CBS 101889]|uniref:Cyanovirin-N domain-containing protein n=1 Tax=Aspergillus homomorphus (strain CBS 101889) TaxID=1450537 RepID=A0A395HQZ0_ASPHC|nr:hypothetical protein BO97DRAFT_426695 [Aspergillus homomorphus CBS 101889]RAL10170.1 hypothetical protein BO97DRAFT_426695 [Aspergillus homomorphus CBS 101889]
MAHLLARGWILAALLVQALALTVDIQTTVTAITPSPRSFFICDRFFYGSSHYFSRHSFLISCENSIRGRITSSFVFSGENVISSGFFDAFIFSSENIALGHFCDSFVETGSKSASNLAATLDVYLQTLASSQLLVGCKLKCSYSVLQGISHHTDNAFSHCHWYLDSQFNWSPSAGHHSCNRTFGPCIHHINGLYYSHAHDYCMSDYCPQLPCQCQNDLCDH